MRLDLSLPGLGLRLWFLLGLGLSREPGLGLRLEGSGGLGLRMWMPCLGWMDLQDGGGLECSVLGLGGLRGPVLGRGVDRM